MANIEMNVLKVGNSEFEIADAAARQDVSNLKDDFHSYNSELGAGYADQIVSGIQNEDSVPYNFRKVPYDATLEKVEGIVGCDVVLNQYCTDPTFTDESKWYHSSTMAVTISNNVAECIASARYAVLQNFGIRSAGTLNGHVVGVLCDLKADESYSIEVIFGDNVLFTDNFPKSIGTSWATYGCFSKHNTVTMTSVYAGIRDASDSGWKKIYVKNYRVFDLTATFGTAIADYIYSLETATAGAGVAWLKEHFSKIFDSGYVPYNAGTMVHVSGLSAKKTVGKNQINVNESESGGINASGAEVTDPNNWRGTEYIPVIGGMKYVLSSQIDTKRLYFYDESYNFISPRVEGGPPAISATAPVNAKYARWTLYKGSLMTLDDVKNSKTQLEFGSTATTYEPYTMHEYPLDSTIDLHGILKLDSNNQLYADGDVYKADGSVNRRYGVVDLGTLNWTKSGNPQRFEGSAIPNAKAPATTYTIPDIMTDIYMPTYSSDGSSDRVIILNINGEPRIYDSAKYQSMSASEFKTAMNGVMCVYELATPTTETAEPYNPNQICDPNGTEEYISDTVAPVGHVTKYPENLRKKIEGLPWNFASLIAPTEATFVATRNYTTGSLFIVNNVLYKATANIANGATITPNSNCTSTTLAEVISALS